MRDEFSKAAAETLAKRVGNRCSNPGCQKRTSGPHTEDGKALNVGVAAHISAASPGGPRYDPSLTPHERKGIGNGIWLCQSCAKLVDNDQARYAEEMLLGWKQDAEQDAEQEALEQIESPSTCQKPGADGHSIRFAVDDWNVWRERGNLPGDLVVVISGWARGNIRYSCTIRLRTDSEWDVQLHRLRIEFRRAEQVLLTDEYAFDDEEAVLPPRRWVSLDVSHGVRERELFEQADSVWFTAETVGDNVRHEWRMASPRGRVDDLPEA